jgi:hypothetical protein
MKNFKHCIIFVLAVCLAGICSFPCQAEDQETVSLKFKHFAGKWIGTLQDAYLHTKDAPKLVITEDQYAARYYYLDESSIKTSVKKAGGTGNMYTGMLQYKEYLLESTGKTRDLAESGKFTVRSVKQMTEIFLYDNGSWER